MEKCCSHIMTNENLLKDNVCILISLVPNKRFIVLAAITHPSKRCGSQDTNLCRTELTLAIVTTMTCHITVIIKIKIAIIFQ